MPKVTKNIHYGNMAETFTMESLVEISWYFMQRLACKLLFQKKEKEKKMDISDFGLFLYFFDNYSIAQI